MLRGVVDPEAYNNAVQEAVFTVLLAFVVEIVTGVENQFIFTCCEGITFQQGSIAAAIGIGGHARDRNISCSHTEKFYQDSRAGAAICSIQHMCSQSSHCALSPSLNRMLLLVDADRNGLSLCMILKSIPIRRSSDTPVCL